MPNDTTICIPLPAALKAEAKSAQTEAHIKSLAEWVRMAMREKLDRDNRNKKEGN